MVQSDKGIEGGSVFRVLSRGSYLYGLGLGAAAFIGGYLITFIIKPENIISRVSPISSGLADPPAIWQAVGWIYFAMHSVPISVSLSGSIPLGRTSEPVAASSLVSTELLVLPLCTLAIAGYLMARKTAVQTFKRGAVAGATPVLGYLPLSVVSAILFTWSYNGKSYRGDYFIEVGPELLSGVILAGSVYPLVLCSLGGVVAVIIENSGGSYSQAGDPG